MEPGDIKPKQIPLRLAPEKIRAIDEARGKQSRQRWLEAAIDAALVVPGATADLRDSIERQVGGTVSAAPPAPDGWEEPPPPQPRMSAEAKEAAINRRERLLRPYHGPQKARKMAEEEYVGR